MRREAPSHLFKLRNCKSMAELGVECIKLSHTIKRMNSVDFTTTFIFLKPMLVLLHDKLSIPLQQRKHTPVSS